MSLAGLYVPRVVITSLSLVPSCPSEADARSSGTARGVAGETWTTGVGFHGGAGASNTRAPYTADVLTPAPVKRGWRPRVSPGSGDGRSPAVPGRWVRFPCDGGGHVERVQGRHQSGRARVDPGLEPVRRGVRARGRAQRVGRPLRRHGSSGVVAIWRAD